MKPMILPLLFLALAASRPPPAFAQIEEVTVEVDGLACPFCAYGLEKNLKRIDGVEEVAIDVDQGIATLTPVAGKVVDVGSVPAAIQDAGFSTREIRVSAAGRIEGRADRTVLVAPDGTPLFRLEPNDALSSAGIDDGKTYEVRGVVAPPGEDAEGGESGGLPLLALTQAIAERAEG